MFRIALAVWLLAPASGFAVDRFVTNKTQFTAVMSVVQPGDVIIWKNGTNDNQGVISFEPVTTGTAALPITLRAETPGGVLFRGNSQLQLGGRYLVVSGFRFDNTGFSFSDSSTVAWVIQTRAHSDLTRHAYNCRVTDCAIINYDNPAATSSSKWLEWYGATNRFDHNYVSGKRTQGAVFIVELSDQANNIEAHHTIDNNVFADRTPGPSSNEYETVRVGTSSYSDEIARVTVESNYFYRCSGEAEFISNKSCENTYRYNMFVECAGSLTLRHGRGCLVEGNVFLGNNATNTGGIRVVNQDHIIINNHLQDLAGTDYQAALAIMDGTTPGASNPDLSGSYVQVSNVVIAHNTFFNVKDAVNYGVGKGGSGRTTPPRDFTLAGNLIFTTNAPIFTITDTPINVTYSSNIVWSASTGLSANPGLMVTNPLLSADIYGIRRPATNSPAKGRAGTQSLFPGNLLDMDGALRPLNGRDIGADQIGLGTRPVAPLTASEVGPTWMSPYGLNPNLPPSGNFNLARWKVTLPDQTEKLEQQLTSGFQTNDFYTDPITGGMVFRCPNNGATGGSSYPRSELREMLRAGNTSISTSGINSNNWVFSSAPPANQQAAGGVDGTMTATLTVDYVGTNGSSSVVGRVIVGQIHASVNEPCRLYYRKRPGNSKGSIYFAHEPASGFGSEQWYEMIGSRGDNAPNPADGIALGEAFSYEITAVSNTLTVTILRAGKPNVTTNVNISASGYANDWVYFKAGNYNQNNEGSGAGDYAQVTFYALAVSHGANSSGAPAITTQPTNLTVSVGSNATFSVSASGTPPLSYRWRFNVTNNIAGGTNASLTITNTQTANVGSYTVVITNSSGAVTSSVATLTILTAPAITTQPTNQTVNAGQNAGFSVTASGSAPLSYQWRFNVTNNLANATIASLTITNSQAINVGSYTVVVTNSAGSVTSSVATLTVNAVAPAITTQPTNQTVTGGQNASFSVVASGTSPLSYQWRFNATNNLASATNASLTITNAQTNNAGDYTVVITNSAGSITSSVATLTVSPPAAGGGTISFTWDKLPGTAGIQDGSGTWDTTSATWLTNGAGTATAFVNGSDAVFGGGTSGTAGTIGISSISVGNIIFNPPFSGNYTIGNSTTTLTLTNSPTITVNNGGDATILANLAGTGYTKDGVGTLTLTTSSSTVNTFSGPVIVQAGTLTVGGTSAKPVISFGGLLINTGAVFSIASSKSGLITSVASVTNMGGTFIAGGTETVGNLVLGGDGVITNGSTSSRTFTVANTIILQSGIIAWNPQPAKLILDGAASLVKTTSGTVYILGTTSSQVGNTFTGKSTLNGGILNIGLDAALGSNPGSFVADQLTLDGGTLQITNAYTWGSRRGVTLTTNGGTLDIGFGVSQTVPVVIAGALNGSLTKGGAGSLTLNTASTYNGDTVISNGTLALGASGTIASSPNIRLASGATLDVSAAGLSLGSSQTLAGSGTVTGNAVMMSGAKVQPGVNALKLSVSGNLTLNSNLITVDAGGVTLGTGTYRLIDYSGNKTGLFQATPTILNGAAVGTATIDQSTANQINLVIGSAPVSNTPPVANSDSYTRGSNLSLKILIASLLTNDTDVDNDILSVAAISATTTNGKSLATNSTYIFYPNNLNVTDAFNYTVSDGNGGSSIGAVVVTVSTNLVGQVKSVLVAGASSTMDFAGIPGYEYEVQRSTNLTNWVVLLTTNAPPSGRFQLQDFFTDLGSPPSQAYYRLHIDP